MQNTSRRFTKQRLSNLKLKMYSGKKNFEYAKDKGYGTQHNEEKPLALNKIYYGLHKPFHLILKNGYR